MTKISLLAATALLTLAAGCAVAGPHLDLVARADTRPVLQGGSILYNQNSNHGYSIISQNFTSGSFGTAYNSAAADDFVVPKGKDWKLTRVDVAGQYFEGTGPASSEVITFYRNGAGHPGTVVGSPQTLKCTDTAGNFACTIKPVILSGGTKGRRYWLSVVANCDSACGEWGWIQNTTTHHDPGQWENPGGGLGFGCTSWNATSSCITLSGVVDDFAFDLRGKSN